MQLQQLIYLSKIADLGSINKASIELFVSQPNLSKSIQNLEEELNIQIFKRNNHGVTLTEDGKKLYHYTQTILKQVELISRISEIESPQTLSISSYPNIAISKILTDVYTETKNNPLLIQLVEDRIQKVINFVGNGTSELGIIFYNNVQVKEIKKILLANDLVQTVIADDTWYVNVSENSPFYHQSSVNIADLLSYPVVRMPDDYFSNLTFYLTIDNIPLTMFKRVIYMSDGSAILNTVKYTDAFRFAPRFGAKELEKYGIKTIPIKNCDVSIKVAYIKKRRTILSQAALSFIEKLEKYGAIPL